MATPRRDKHHLSSSRGGLSFQSPPPDASEISPASSDVLSPRSTSSRTTTASAGSDSAPPQELLKTASLPRATSSTRDPGEEFPLSSRIPSRGPSHGGSIPSLDGAPADVSRQPRGARLPVDARNASRGDARSLSRNSSASRESRSRENSFYYDPQLFVNDASRRHWLEDQRRQKMREEKERIWQEQLANRKKFLRPEEEKKRQSVMLHRDFNKALRRLHGKPLAENTEAAPRAVASSRVLNPVAFAATRPLHHPREAAGNAITLDEVTNYIESHVQSVIAEHLSWIGRAGDADRQRVPPLLDAGVPTTVELHEAKRVGSPGSRMQLNDSNAASLLYSPPPRLVKETERQRLQMDDAWFDSARRQFRGPVQ